jgi:hypothetical protein
LPMVRIKRTLWLCCCPACYNLRPMPPDNPGSLNARANLRGFFPSKNP